ncbi:hypothetical protein C8J56DRAFT_1131896 [Mycena floridula]|nr:hypothetical protein C8J56DRAFT_1131896 [Mycena floridula]
MLNELNTPYVSVNGSGMLVIGTSVGQETPRRKPTVTTKTQKPNVREIKIRFDAPGSSHDNPYFPEFGTATDFDSIRRPTSAKSVNSSQASTPTPPSPTNPCSLGPAGNGAFTEQNVFDAGINLDHYTMISSTNGPSGKREPKRGCGDVMPVLPRWRSSGRRVDGGGDA